MNDEFFIRKTLILAKRSSGRTSPNPMVGALLVKNGRIIAEGYHKKAGTPHAEVITIDNAKGKAGGATLYVNLEPCCHKDKRTPPCTKKIIASGIKKVVIAMNDPNPKVFGKGILELKKAGIEVITGILEDKARKLNEFYVKHISTGMPFVIMKAAMTLDGKIAAAEGESKWITGEKSRGMVHRIRSSVDAVMTAVGTVKADNPLLTARIKGSRNPIRIVIDPYLETPLKSNILNIPPETIIVTKTNNNKFNYLIKSGINIILYKENLKLKWLMKKLRKMGIGSVLTEGGSSLNAHLIEEGIVDKIMFFIAPKIIGGKDSLTVVGGKTFKKLKDAYCIKDISVKRIGEDILIEGYTKN